MLVCEGASYHGDVQRSLEHCCFRAPGGHRSYAQRVPGVCRGSALFCLHPSAASSPAHLESRLLPEVCCIRTRPGVVSLASAGTMERNLDACTLNTTCA